MYLSRLLIYSVIALTTVIPTYSSDANNIKNQDFERQDNERLNPHKRQVNDINSPTLPERIDEQPKKHLADQLSVAIPVLKSLSSAEQLALIDQANNGDQAAQDEVVVYIYWSSFDYAYMIRTETWKNLQEKAKSCDLYCHLLVTTYFYGQYTDLFPNLFTDLTEKAQQGNPFAQYNLGIAYEIGIGMVYEGGTDRDVERVKGLEWVRKAAGQGLAPAQYDLGKRYYQGDGGVAEDLVKAVEWYQKAAEQGLVSAQYALSIAYWWGDGIVKDPVKAVEWYLKAVSAGEKEYVETIQKILIFQPDAPMVSESLSQKAQTLYEISSNMTAHCQQKMIANNPAKAFVEAKFAIEELCELYKPIYEFGDRLSPILLALMKSQPGLMVSCVKAHEDLAAACSQQQPTSLLISPGGAITFGEINVRAVLQFQDYQSVWEQEFEKVRRGLEAVINVLSPISSLHACQQAIFSAQSELREQPDQQDAFQRLQNTQERFREEKEEFASIKAINQIEIDILKGFLTMLSELAQGLKDLLPSTIGARNKECIESPKFSYLKPCVEVSESDSEDRAWDLG